MAAQDLDERVRGGAQDLAHDVRAATVEGSASHELFDDDAEALGVLLDLRIVERPYPAVCVAGDAPVDLLGPRDGIPGQARMVGQVGRLEQAGASRDGEERIGGRPVIHPRTDEAVRMIDSNAVVLAGHLPDPRAEEREGLARIGPEHGIAPGLALRIGTTRGRAERVRFEKEMGALPSIARRKTDLQVAEELPPELACAVAKGGVLRVHDELRELVALGGEPGGRAQHGAR